ncbi:MAG: TCP-1/cpn60 chaperonin family protein, partial [Halobacteriaceae archaeon]
MAQQMGNQPLIVLSEESQRTSGKDAQSMNITAGKAVAESVRTTLGPKGMDKMLVDSSGNVVVTNDGVTILKEMEIEHPAANMVVEVAETQENEVGTTTAVIIAGELLSEAEDLLDQDIHPTTLAQGYRDASVKAKEILDDLSIEVSPDDTEILEQIAATAMTGKGAESAKETLA